MDREQENRPDMAEQSMSEQGPEDAKAKFAKMVSEAQENQGWSRDKYLPKKVLPQDMEGQSEFNAIDKEEVQWHADNAKALRDNSTTKGLGRFDELPQDVQTDLGVRWDQLKEKIDNFNQKYQNK